MDLFALAVAVRREAKGDPQHLALRPSPYESTHNCPEASLLLRINNPVLLRFPAIAFRALFRGPVPSYIVHVAVTVLVHVLVHVLDTGVRV